MDIVKNGQTNYKVYLYEGAGKTGLFAKNELIKYFKKITGITLPDASAPGNETFILGLRNEMFGLPECKKGYDGYTIVITETSVTICGENPRGLLYGVYDILEKFGCRFYLPQLDPKDWEVVPRLSSLSLGTGHYTEASPMEYRVINAGAFIGYFEKEMTLEQIDWAAKNRYNGLSWQPPHHKGALFSEIENLEKWGGIEMLEERDLILHGPGHSFYHFLQTDEYFKEHPEYFGMLNGERTDNILVNFCWSNEDAVRICQDNIIKFVKKYPIIKILYLVATDGGLVCGCPKCQEMGGSNLLINFFNVLSERMEKELPGVYLEGVVGYGPMEDIPEKIKPNGKWGGLHAHWGRNHTKAYGDSEYSNYPELYIWTKLFEGKLEICSYYTDLCHQPYTGVPYLYALDADMEFMINNNIKGSFILNHPVHIWWTVAFNNFMAGRIAYYYPGLKSEDALRDFCYSYFGEKAGEVMFKQKKILSDNLDKLFNVIHQGAANQWDMQWLGYLQKMNSFAKYLTDGLQPYTYRIEKNEMLFRHQIMWADRESRLNRCKEAVEKAQKGIMSKDEAKAVIGKEKQFMEELKAFSYELHETHPGVMDPKWFEDWNLNRCFYSPLEEIEKRLDAIE